MKVIFLSAGHNVNYKYFDCGSIGNGLRECDITKETVSLLAPNLRKMGYIVHDVTPYNEHFKSKKEAHLKRAGEINYIMNRDKLNKSEVLYMDIHINAATSPQATGVEILLNASNKYSYPVGLKIVNQISKDLNLRNRGLKHAPGFWSISQPIAPAMIIEGAFITNTSDMKKLNARKYADSILKVFGTVEGEEKVDIKNIAMEIDGKEQKVDSINVDGKNYVDLRAIIDLLGLQITNKGSKPIITPRNELAVVNGLERTIESIKLNKDTNFIKLRELEDLLNIDYIDKKIIIDK